MAAITLFDNIEYDFVSDDGSRKIIITDNGFFLESDLLTPTAHIVQMTATDIIDLEHGTQISFEELTDLPVRLSAIPGTAPPNPQTLVVEDTIFINGTGFLGNDTNTVNNSSMSIYNVDTGNTYTIGKNNSDLEIASDGDRLLLNSGVAESYWGDYSIGTNANISLNLGGNCSCDIDTRSGVCNIGDINGVNNSTAINLDDTSQSITTTANVNTFNSGDFIVNAVNDINMLATNNIDITTSNDIDIISSTADINLTANLGNVYINNTISNAGDGNLVVTDITAPIDLTMNSLTGNVNINATGSIIANSSNIELVSGIGAVIIGDVNNSFFGTKISLNDATETVTYTGNQTWNGTSNTLNWSKTTDILSITNGIDNTTSLTSGGIIVNNANGGNDPLSTTITPNSISFLTGDVHIFCNMYGNQLTFSDNTFDDNSQLNNSSLQFLANTIPSVISNSGGQSLSITTDDILNITGDVAITFDTPTIDFLNTTTTTSIGNHNADIQSTSSGLTSTTFLKVKLNGSDIWIPYFTTDPSL